LNKQLNIYYFSGTGNAKNAALWMIAEAQKYNVKTEMIDISRIDRRNISTPEQDSMIGFSSPTHGFNFPPVMMKFLLRFPKSKFKNPVFIMNTRGGLKFGKIFFPGLSGITQYFYSLMLLLKGYRVVGMRGIDLPSNWISLHPGLNNSAIQQIYERRKETVHRFAEKIFNGKKDLHALLEIVQDLLISPISVAYYIAGRFILAKSFYANCHCNNCNLCVDSCPIKAIIKVDGRPFWTYKCESCMRCMNDCPNRAIETAHGFIIGLIYLINIFVLSYFWSAVHPLLNRYEGLGYWKYISWLIENAIVIGLLFIAYRILHRIIRFPVIKQIIEYTSLTKFTFWKRYKIKKIMKQ